MTQINLVEVLGEPRQWSGQNGGTFDSYKVKAEDGTVYEINVKGGNPPPKLGPDEFDVTPPKEGTSFPPKLKRQFSGGGGGGQRNAAKDAYWEAKEQRDIEGVVRMGRAHAQEMALVAIRLYEDTSQAKASWTPDNFKDEIKRWTDWFQADVDAAAPTQSAPSGNAPDGMSPAVQHRAEGRDSARGFTSDKQKRFMQSLLEKAGGSPETVGTILTYCSETLTPTDVSAAIDTLNSDNPGAVRACAKELAQEANNWIVRDTPFPADESDLPQVAA